MTFDVEPLSPDLSFGKTIRGLTSAHIRDEAVREELRRLWISDGLIVFRDGEVNEAFHLALSRVFGPLEAHAVREFQIDGKPELVTLRSRPGDAIIYEMDGEVGGGFIGWHSDLVFVERVNHGGILRAIKPTARGGITGFIDQIDAYDRLPDDLKARIEHLHVVYRFGPHDAMRYANRSTLRMLSLPEWAQRAFDRRDRDFPPVAHPLVWTQPETGRKLLNLSPYYAIHIEELGEEGGHELLQALVEHIWSRPAYHHAWTRDEMVLWDNWRMLHSVTMVPVDEERIMQRTTISGDYGFGRTLASSVPAG